GWVGGRGGGRVGILRGIASDLPIPATAEVIFEGEMPPPEEGTDIEGPFGEFSGYYGGGGRPAPVAIVKRILYRNNPIILGSPPLFGSSRGGLFSRGIFVWDELGGLGVSGIQEGNYSGGMCIISLKQAYPGHAMRTAHGAVGGTAGYHGRFVIVVDDDIDPYNLEQVLWAIATRCDPETSLDVCRRIWSYKIDPRLP